MTNQLVRPGVYEVLVGIKGDRVIHVHSFSEAQKAYRDLVKQGVDCAIYLGDLLIEGLPIKEFA